MEKFSDASCCARSIDEMQQAVPQKNAYFIDILFFIFYLKFSRPAIY